MAKSAAKDDAKSEPIPADIQAMSFEQALAALDDIVQKLETGRVGLEESINIYTRGTLLRRHCEAKLTAAGERVEKIVVGADGSAAGVEPADIK
ncbi:MAG TPA: exodeoxyribonuclease VII small subunit [Candidatus Cybelea sp.]|nr:exodeoxyribonuclease VII small subunit [Candidatus Cybelea sp.]